jgi:hypothetical protein
MRRQRARSYAAALLTLSLAPLPALAQSSAAEKAAAEALFDQGKKLMAEGKHAEACPKFAESQRLDAGIGTMLYLSDCYEKIGRTASAWASFREAESAARASGQAERARIARDRAAALEPKLSRLTINVSPKAGELPGVVVKRDGSALSNALWNSPLPVDPGAHAIEATAPGYRAFKATIEVRPGGGSLSAEVPALEKEAAPAPTAPVTIATVNPGSRWPVQKTFALIAGGVGVAGLAAGSIFGLRARSSWKDYEATAPTDCNSEGRCVDPAYTNAKDAKRDANLATLGFGVGVLGLAGGVVLWLTAPKAPEPSAATRWQFAPVVGTSGVGAEFGRRW